MKREKMIQYMELLDDTFIAEAAPKHAVNTDEIKEAAMKKNHFRSGLQFRKTALIAAAIALLLCGTAAAAGLFWMKPNVQSDDNSQTLQLGYGKYTELPEQTVQTILQTCVPDRGYMSFFYFETVQEWQEFFALPFVIGAQTEADESPVWANHGTGALVPEGSIQTLVTTEETDGKRIPCLMTTHMDVEQYRGEGDGKERIWQGFLTIHAPLNENAAMNSKFIRQLGEDDNAEIMTEGTTESGIPYVISKITHNYTSEGVEYTDVNLLLYYGYDAVMYELQISGVSETAVTEMLEHLTEFAENLQIRKLTE